MVRSEGGVAEMKIRLKKLYYLSAKGDILDTHPGVAELLVGRGIAEYIEEVPAVEKVIKWRKRKPKKKS